VTESARLWVCARGHSVNRIRKGEWTDLHSVTSDLGLDVRPSEQHSCALTWDRYFSKARVLIS
jgi:hypothetical protein